MGDVGTAHGKLLLFGEHAAVYGHAAVGVSIPERTTVHVEDAGEWNLDSVPSVDRAPVRDVLRRMEGRLPGLRRGAIRIESDIPRGVGFGSSAALCVAIARALAPEDCPPDAVWSLAHEAEHLFHGRPSGVDTGISVLGATCILRPRPPGLPRHTIIRSPGLHLVMGAVRRDERCLSLIGGLAERMESGDRTVHSCIAELGELSETAARLLQSGGRQQAQYLGRLADAAMDPLRSLGLVTPDLELVVEAARSAGALGAKLSGAGGGGAFYAVAEDGEAAAVIAGKIGEAAASAGVPLIHTPRVLAA